MFARKGVKKFIARCAFWRIVEKLPLQRSFANNAGTILYLAEKPG